MNDNSLSNNVRQAAARAAERQKAVDLADLWEKLTRIDPEDIQEKLEGLDQEYWYGAVPAWEPTGYTRFSKREPLPAIGIDGSQIYPDTDEPVLWGYIQAITYKMGVKPAFQSDFFDIGSMLEDGLDLPDYQDMRGMLAGGFVEWFNSQRTHLELRSGIQAAEQYPDDVVLLDNPLLPRITRTGHSMAQQMNAFLHWFAQLRGRMAAGIVSGPKSKLLANLITLSESESPDTARAPWSCISDTTLMSYGLEIGQRSAIFLHGNARNRQLYDSKAGIYFFFLQPASMRSSALKSRNGLRATAPRSTRCMLRCSRTRRTWAIRWFWRRRITWSPSRWRMRATSTTWLRMRLPSTAGGCTTRRKT